MASENSDGMRVLNSFLCLVLYQMSLEGCSHLPELLIHSVTTQWIYSSLNHDGVLIWIIGSVVAWDIKDSRDGLLVYDHHVPDIFSGILRDQKGTNVGSKKESVQSSFDFVFSSVPLDDPEFF